jgi:acyl transferase domain-containing protein/NADPH:quinone reductase-like Zn-dependent oxidoreductase/acyl carrier protein/NADP-dependent 3-hydroxy acid dehydrogenase YdfG/SAM-dependent methyltransferase
VTGNRDRSPIAVIGFSFRMPGGTNEALWTALLAGRDLVTSVESDRWAQDTLTHPNKAEPGTSYTFAAGSIGDIAGFDAAFFSISPREAEQMDPQQRVLLEMSLEAFEHAGIPPSSMRGSRCGVYVGLSSVDYAYRRADDLGAIDATTMTGNAGSIAANRLSYVFDLRGPSMTIDTACSSSLVAFHQACQSIRSEETDAALVGGISLHLHPYGFIGFSKASMLSRHGRCRVFDAGADGYVRSEGGGVVLLKPLARALADGNRILAVVAGTGVNSDGRKAGLTVPSHEAQAELLREVYGRAGIAPGDIDYFEAHGTGTAVGDPLETRAIGEAIGRHRSPESPLPIGSIKGNIGHLEAAAGMAGLFKALYVLRDRCVPANLHLANVNPHIDVAGWNLKPVTEALALGNERLVVGVSAFGFGGTNAHAVLMSYEEEVPVERLLGLQPSHTLPNPPLLLSARSPQALRDMARDMAQHLSDRKDLSDYDIAYSAAHHRDVNPHRLAAVSADRHELTLALEQFGITGSAVGITLGKHRPEASAPAFVYSGNGSQWAGMGLQLLQDDTVFREALMEVDALYARRCGESILAELNAPLTANKFALTEIAQPALFAIQVALTRALERRGIRPIAVCGHSVGEVAAAWASGALTLDQAVRVIHERSSHQARTRGQGCMTAVSSGRDKVAELLATLQLDERLTIAAVNAANAVTLAGETQAMTLLEDALAQRRIAYQRLALEYAFHSPTMNPIGADLMHALSGLEMRSAALPMYSSVTGDRVGPNAIDAAYWWRNVREPVNFEAAIRSMIDAGINTFVEIGPRAILTAYLTEITKPLGAAALVLPGLTRKEAGGARLSELATQLELSGGLRDRARLFPVPGRCVDLPHYPWQRERHWHPSTSESQGRLTRRILHPLLGYALKGEALHWENHVDLATLPVYADHVVGGAAVLPASGFVEMALAAGLERRRLEERVQSAPQVIEDLEILAPLLLESDRSRTVRLRVDAVDGRFAIVSRERLREDPWRTHATGRLVEDCVATSVPPLTMATRDPDVPAEAHYAFASTLGLHYGPAFRSVASVWYRREGVLGAIATPPEIAAETATALLHPAYLDGAFQLLADLALRDQRDTSAQRAELPAFLPVRIDRLELMQPHSRVAVALASPADPEPRSRRSLRANFTLYDAFEAPIAIAHGVRFRAIAMQAGTAQRARWISTRAVPMPRRDPNRAVPLPAIGELARHCAARLHTPERLAARGRFSQEFEPLLDALCASFAAQGLRELAGDQPIEPHSLIESGRIAASSAPMLRNLLQLLTEDGVVQPIANQWLWCTDVTLPKPEDIWTSLISDYPEYAPLTARVGAAGLHLAERLRAGAHESVAKPGYADTVCAWADSCTQQEAAGVAEALADVLRCAAAAQPEQARLRVLRFVGTSPAEGLALVPALDADRCDVVIGTASQAELDDLRGRWPAIDALECRIVDLDRDPIPGDAQPHGGGFDIVVLGEGVADAPDPARRLRNARRLLLDDGRLVFIEKHASRAADLVFGLEPHWWRGSFDVATDATVRSRTSAPEAWRGLLAQAGFETIEAVHDVPEAPTGPYVLIAQADTALQAAPQPTPAPVRTWLIARDAAGYSADLGQALGAALAAAGQRIITVIASPIYERIDAICHALDPADASHWERLLVALREAGDEPHGWIHLVGLDLATALSPLAARVAAQESRAEVFTAWLRTCARRAIRPECWVIAAHAGTALLPIGALGSAMSEAPPVDRLRDAALWGIARVAMHECADRRIRWLDLHDPIPCMPNAAKLAQEILHPDAEDEILLTASGRYVPRLSIAARPRPAALIALQPTPPRVQLDCSVPGPFRNLAWRAPPDLGPLGEDEVEIEVRAAGLNFRDVMYAMGLLPDEALENGFCGPTLGMEVAGIVTRVGAAVIELAPSDAVIAFAPASFANHVRTRSLAVTRKPASWSFAAAATVPSAFFTAYYALHELARVQEGERVLIHGAAGGVGIAAIQLAKYMGAEIFATAGSDAKRDFVRLLGADHVFDSRSLAFADEVMRATDGAGVDVVLNSLAGDAIPRNLRLLRPFGRMLELGKRDFYENSRIGLRPLRNNISYFGIDADQLLAQRPDTARRVFIDLMALFADGSLHPLPHRTFDAADIATAFRHMQASRHIGKVVVTFAPDFDPLGPPQAERPPVAKADATYVVTGGLSGFGLRTAWWLVRHGARHIALLSRRGAAGTPGAAAILDEFAAAGVSIVAPACNVTDEAALRDALASIDAQMPPLRGIVHAAMVIEDALLRDMDPDQLHRVLAPKLRGALQLHEATRTRELDFFILYSSATTLFGNPGQAAYVAANMALEALATERRALGLSATCIGWGPIADAGYLARNERVLEALVGRMGGAALRSEDAFLALETMLGSCSGNLGLIDLDWATLGRFLPAAQAPKFSNLARSVIGDRGAHGAESAQELRRRLDGLTGAALTAALTEIVRAEVANILRIAPERIEPGISLLDMGMDSLMAVELVTSIEARLDIQLSALAVSGGPTIESVVERIVRLLHPAEEHASSDSGGAALAEQVFAVASQHIAGLTAENAVEFSAAIGAAAAPLSLTAGQRP